MAFITSFLLMFHFMNDGIYYIIFIDVSFYECTLFAIFAG